MGQKTVTYGVGQELFRQGDTGGELFFIQKGRVELTVRHESTGEAAVVAVVEDKSVLGTMSFMEGELRSATAKALTEVECVIVNQVQREKMLEAVPPWFKILVKDLSGNLRKLNLKYTELKARFEAAEKKLKSLQKKNEEPAPAKEDEKPKAE